MSERRDTEDFLSSETGVLVNRTRRYRKVAMRALISLAVLGVVSAAFFCLAVRSSEPEVAQHYPLGQVREKVGQAKAEGIDEAALEAKAEQEAPPTDEAPKEVVAPSPQEATVKVSLSRRGTFWVGNENRGVGRKFEVSLPSGKHVLKAKMGRKSVVHRMEMESGATYKITFNHRRKKAKVQRLSE
jgi:hypothetical protein